jgi:arylsulfatase B/arylsulfatase I/J
VNRIQKALDAKAILNNTYIIFSSDNGGCHAGGGKNGPLRGTKGSLFEGGVKVDAFIYSPLLPARTAGLQYAGLMHISDWFPTILQLSDITFTPSSGYELDGVSHVDAWKEEDQSAVEYPRSVLLYNYYANVDFYTFNMWVNGSFAVRDTQYKLMHAFNSSTYAVWYTTESIDEDDDALDADVRCAPQAGFGDGDFTVRSPPLRAPSSCLSTLASKLIFPLPLSLTVLPLRPAG